MAEPVTKQNALVRRAETLPLALPTPRRPVRTAPLVEREQWKVLGPAPKKRRLGLGTLAIGLVAANVLLYTVTVIQEAGLSRLQSDIREQRQELVRLRTELARVQALDQVEANAKTMGMVRPNAALYVSPPAPVDPRSRVAGAPFGAPEGY